MTSNTKLSDEEKNWNDLPVEMRLECIKRMDLPTRWALHYTSHAEKELVESTKWDRELLGMSSFDARFVECSSSSSSSEVLFNFEHENHAALEIVLRMAKFECVCIDCSKPSFQNFLEIFMKFPCSVQRLVLFEATKYDLEILRHCRGLEKLEFESRDRDGITLRELLNDYEIIVNTKDVRLYNIGSIKPEDVVQLIEKWIADDKEMGWEFVIYGSQTSSQQVVDIREGLKNAFRDRFQVVEVGSTRLYISFKTDKYIKVHFTKNRSKGTFLRVVDKVPNLNDVRDYY